MDEHSLIKEAFNWLLGTVVMVAVTVLRIAHNRSSKRQDDIEERVRLLEKESVTHADLQRLEDKMDKLVDRLDRILERG